MGSIPPAISDFLFYPLFREEIERYSKNPGGTDAARLLRLEREVAFDRPLLDAIAACALPEKFFFSAKDHPFVLGGLGSAQVAAAAEPDGLLEQFRGLWEADPAIPVFGGFSFDTGEESAREWEPFDRFRFTLPRIELRQSGRRTSVAVNHLCRGGQSTREALAEISAALCAVDAASRRPAAAEADPSCGPAKQPIPGKAQWNRMVQRALHTIRAGELQKVVLARKMVITRTSPWDPAEIMATLAKIEENSFTFCYQIADGTAFVGRSPERLFRMQEGRITAEAIAGTRPRGKAPSDDRRLESELIHSPKELAEHRFVAGFVETAMKQICADVRMTASEEILKLENVQHILSRFTGRSTEKWSPLAIARLFHPTPAVGGYPREGISAYLRSIEPFQRGWYGSPVGWMNRSNADFAVGIRSALVRGNELHIFAGAGIVGESNAGDEWKETEKKMDNFTALLRERPCHACR